jgi:pimeloyl-ACP methyl ester carboxylesterase
MPVIKAGEFELDYADLGSGPAVVLVHSSASGNRQWRSLTDALKDRHRIIAVNLFGYGGTTIWPADRTQRLADQAELVAAAASAFDRVILIGHSLGAAVSLQTALQPHGNVRALIVFEPILFYMLGRDGLADVFAEINAIATEYRKRGRQNDWEGAGALFVDYWSGPGTWAAMTAERKAGLLKMLPNVVHEWDAVISPGPSLSDLAAIRAPTHLVRAADTRRPTHAIATLLANKQKGWHLHEIPTGGHMAPVTRPDLFNPLVSTILAELR